MADNTYPNPHEEFPSFPEIVDLKYRSKVTIKAFGNLFRHKKTVTFPASLQEIAVETGTSTKTAERSIGDFQYIGDGTLIRKHIKGKIEIVEKDGSVSTQFQRNWYTLSPRFFRIHNLLFDDNPIFLNGQIKQSLLKALPFPSMSDIHERNKQNIPQLSYSTFTDI